MNAQGTSMVVGGIAAAASEGTRACARSSRRSALNWRARFANQLHITPLANSAF